MTSPLCVRRIDRSFGSHQLTCIVNVLTAACRQRYANIGKAIPIQRRVITNVCFSKLRCPSPQLLPCSFIFHNGVVHIIEALGIFKIDALADLIHDLHQCVYLTLQVFIALFEGSIHTIDLRPVIQCIDHRHGSRTVAVVAARQDGQRQHTREGSGENLFEQFHSKPLLNKNKLCVLLPQTSSAASPHKFYPPPHSVNLFLDFWQIAQLS